MRVLNTQDKRLLKEIHAYVALALGLYEDSHDQLASDSGLSISTVYTLVHPHNGYTPSSLTLAKLGRAVGLVLVYSEPSKVTIKLTKAKPRKAA